MKYYQNSYNKSENTSARKEHSSYNSSGCARHEKFKTRRPFDMLSWLTNPHRKIPDYLYRSTSKYGLDCIIGDPDQGNGGGQLLSALKRATDLPVAMRFRHVAKDAKDSLFVFSSLIHGRGLFCKRTILSGEMVIEYAGERIRPVWTDRREKKYESRGIGCYMFKIDDDTVIVFHI